jgi:ATP-dependent Clp protease adaptor protein ClpS
MTRTWQPTASAEDEGRSDIVPDDGGVVTETRTRPQPKLRKPPLYKVLLHNDDFTTREFVVEVLQTVFHHPEPEAVRIMLHVHQRGVGVAGVFTFEVAETKVRTVEALARQREFPLMLSLEPADD